MWPPACDARFRIRSNIPGIGSRTRPSPSHDARTVPWAGCATIAGSRPSVRSMPSISSMRGATPDGVTFARKPSIGRVARSHPKSPSALHRGAASSASSTSAPALPTAARLSFTCLSSVRARPPSRTASRHSPWAPALLDPRVPILRSACASNTASASGISPLRNRPSAALMHGPGWSKPASTVASPAGRGVSFNETSAITPRVPRAPMCSLAMSNPLTFLTTCPPLLVTVPSAWTTFMPITVSRMLPNCHLSGPLAPTASVPPSVALSGSGGSTARNCP